METQAPKSYEGFRRAGIRLTEEPAKGFEHHSSDRELPILYAIHAFDKAHIVMLAEENLIPGQDAASMLQVLRQMEEEGVEKVRIATGGGFHSGEKYLISILGEKVGGRIHLGRSSGDVGVVARRIHQRDKLLNVMQGILAFRDVLLKQAQEHKATVMPGYTFGQHAQPVTLGHTFAAWATLLSRDSQRIEQAYERINTSPAGAAILTGSEFPLNRTRVADLLGFDAVRVNTQDAVLPHDDIFETFTTLTLLTDNLGRWATDLELWMTSEFNFVQIPDRFCGTSSIMPQKKNPNVLQTIRGGASDCFGGLVTAFHAIKGPTGFPILERHYVEDTMRRCLDNTLLHLNAFAELVSELSVNKERMHALAGAHWSQAADIAGALVREKGLPWRTAHQITGILVRIAIERGIAPNQVDSALVDEAAQEYQDEAIGLSEQALSAALDPVQLLQRRTLLGGPAFEETARQVEVMRQEWEADKQRVDDRIARLERASEELTRACTQLIDGQGVASQNGS